MQCHASRIDNVLILAPEGRIDSKTAKEFEGHLLGAIGNGESRIIVDFAKLDYISSAGLRVLLMAAKRLRGGGNVYRLCALSPNIKEVFEVSGFDRMLSIHDDRPAALEGLV